MKYTKIFFLIGLLMTVGFALITPQTYNVNYDDKITIDGKGTDWAASKAYLYDSEVMTSSWYKIAYSTTGSGETLEYFICGYFSIVDGTVDKEYDRFTFVYNAADADNAIRFNRNGRIYDGGGKLINATKYLFGYKRVEVANGWTGEFCFTYDYPYFTNFHPGTGKKFTPVSFGYFNYGGGIDQKSINGQVGTLNSDDYWLEPVNECNTDIDCASSEHCVAAADGDKCLPVTAQGECGYIADHQWNEYQCCLNSDCAIGKICQDHICKIENPCGTDADCADNEYCAPLAAGNSCMQVSPLGECGYATNHQWNEYQCCADTDCGVDQYCSTHQCLDSPPEECNGDVQLEIGYTANQEVLAQISGLDSCDGKFAFIKKDSCSGETVCSMELTSDGGSCSFQMSEQNGWYDYSACVDMNEDNEYFGDEKATESINVNATCEAGCTPTTWSACVCAGTSIVGVTTGSCTDKCGTTNEYTNECVCPPVVIQNSTQQNQTGQSSQNNTRQDPPERPQQDYTVYALAAAGLFFLIVIIAGLMKIVKWPTGQPESKEKTEKGDDVDFGDLDKKPKA